MVIRSFIKALGLLTVLAASAIAQVVPDHQLFDKGGLKFSYPAGWVITDRSTVEMQHLMLSKPGSQVLFIILSPREFLTGQTHYNDIQREIYRKYFRAINAAFSSKGNPAANEGLCLELNARKIGGTRFRGLYNNEMSTGDIYPFGLDGRFVGMVYLRADKDEEAGSAVWQDITKSIAIRTDGKNDFNFDGESLDGGVVNGMATKLVKPDYPWEAANARASGNIEVEVTIDEQGNVVDAEASPGNQYLRFAAMGAARKSKFSPTRVCGKPVKVTGKITYQFAR